MAESSSVLPPNLGKKFVRLAVSVVGLVILRKILGSLPMLKNASAIGDTLLSPLVLTYAVVDTVILLLLLDFGMSLGRDIQVKNEKFADLGKIISRLTLIVVLALAYNAYETPAACFFVDRTDLINLSKSNASGNFGDFMRLWGQMLNQVSAAAVQNATGDALAAYQRLAVAVFRQPPNYYAWVFLVLVAIPFISLIPLVSRNLDALAEVVTRAASAFQGTAQPPSASTAEARGAEERSSGDGHGVPPTEAVEKLVKLKRLLDAGAISNADFEQQKKRVLGQTLPNSRAAAEPEDFQKLKALHDSGGLTAEEYEAYKRLFLERI